MKEIYNAKELVSVKIVDKRVSDGLSFYKLEPKKSWWGKALPEGFYDHFQHCFNKSNAILYSKADLENGEYRSIIFTVENNIAYYRPYVQLNFVNADKKVITCQTYEEALIIGTHYGDMFKRSITFGS